MNGTVRFGLSWFDIIMFENGSGFVSFFMVFGFSFQFPASFLVLWPVSGTQYPALVWFSGYLQP